MRKYDKRMVCMRIVRQAFAQSPLWAACIAMLLATQALCATPVVQPAPMIYSLRALPNRTYQDEALVLAFEKTKSEFGAYQLKKIGSMNISRAMNAVALNAYTNLVIANGYEERFTRLGHLTYIPVPVDLGLTGYRLCMSSKVNKTKIAAITSIEQLKKFSIVQGLGWPDSSILKLNGFKVIEMTDSSAESMLKMVAAGRADLYCQSISQYWGEYSRYKGHIDIDLNETFVLFYPLARFFYINTAYPQEIKRLQKGLEVAASDDSLRQLWLHFNKVSFEHANLKSRRLLTLENPHLDSFDKSYQKFFVDPYKL